MLHYHLFYCKILQDVITKYILFSFFVVVVVLLIKQISIASNGVVALNENSPYKLPATTGGLTSYKYITIITIGTDD